MQGSTEETLHANEQEEARKTLGGGYSKEDDDDSWDLWQFWNQVLHLPTGPLAVAIHHPLNYRISKETVRGRDAIAPEHYHLFFSLNTAPLVLTRKQLKSSGKILRK